MEGLSKSEGNLEHEVIEVARPIMTSIGTFETYNDLKEKYPDLPNLDNDLGLSDVMDVDWFSDQDTIDAMGLLNAGQHTYVISKLDEKNKISKSFSECTGIISSGLEKATGRYISFMTHQDLPDLSPEERDQFIDHLKQRFLELKGRCTPDSIEVLIIGGNQSNRHSNEYTDGISFLTEEIKKDIDLYPVIIGPKILGVYDNAYFDNINRRLYLVRSDEVNSNTIFKGSEIGEKVKNWKD